MDQAGVTQQVLSIAGPGAELLAGAEAATFAADYNDFIAQMVQAHPDRLAGFAHLPRAIRKRPPTSWSERSPSCGSAAA